MVLPRLERAWDFVATWLAGLHCLDGAFVSLAFSAEEKSYIWLDSFELNETEKRKLLQKAGSALAIVKKLSEFKPLLIEFKKESVYNTMQSSLTDGGKYFKVVLDKLEREGITPIPYGAESYPKAWIGLPNAPLVLYAKGKLSLLQERLFCIVGSRRTPPASLKLTETIARDLASNFVVVTGIADGADSSALAGAVKKKRAISLLAGGFGSIPKSNVGLVKGVAENGLLLAPYPYDVPVFAYSYESRNKLLASLCEGTLVVSAGEKSGALITAKYAKEFGRKIFAIPYPPNSSSGSGCNALIKQGAGLTECAEDILNAYGMEMMKKPQVELSEVEQKTIELLQETGEAHITELATSLGIPVFKVTAILSALETKNLVVKLGGNRYSAV